MLAAASIALSASAQLRVVESGQVQVGTIASDPGYPTIVAGRDTGVHIRLRFPVIMIMIGKNADISSHYPHLR